MSKVTMCDLCGSTAREQSQMKNVKLPEEALPEHLSDVGSGKDRDLDACGQCVTGIQEALDALITRRLGALATEGGR